MACPAQLGFCPLTQGPIPPAPAWALEEPGQASLARLQEAGWGWACWCPLACLPGPSLLPGEGVSPSLTLCPAVCDRPPHRQEPEPERFGRCASRRPATRLAAGSARFVRSVIVLSLPLPADLPPARGRAGLAPNPVHLLCSTPGVSVSGSQCRCLEGAGFLGDALPLWASVSWCDVSTAGISQAPAPSQGCVVPLPCGVWGV